MTDNLPREIERKDLRVGDVFRDHTCPCQPEYTFTVTKVVGEYVVEAGDWRFLLPGRPVTLVDRAEPEPRFVVGREYDVNTLPVGAVWWSRDQYRKWRVDGAHATNLDTGSTIDLRNVDGPRTLVSLPDPYVPPGVVPPNVVPPNVSLPLPRSTFIPADVDEKPMLNLEQAILEAKRTDDESNYPKPKNKFTVKGRVKSVTDCTGRTKTTPRQCRCPFEARSRMRRLSTCDVCDGALPEPPVLESEVTFGVVWLPHDNPGAPLERGVLASYGVGDGVGPTREAALCELEKALGRRIVRSQNG